jgi:hypothetical protein
LYLSRTGHHGVSRYYAHGVAPMARTLLRVVPAPLTQASILHHVGTVALECSQGVLSMGIKGNVVPARAETTVVALVRDDDRFEAVIAPAHQEAQGTHELRYLWNRRPFISGVFQRSTLDSLLASVKALQDELIGRGWHVVGGNLQVG